MEFKKLQLNPAQIQAMKLNIDLFVARYPAGVTLLAIGTRSGDITPIVDRDKKIVVSKEQIRAYCEFILNYGYQISSEYSASSFRGMNFQPVLTENKSG